MTRLTSAELDLLARAAFASRAMTVRVVTRCCLYACCGRGWQLREDYEQTYHGWIGEYDETLGSFALYSPGVGTLSYVIRANILDVELIEQIT